MRAPIISLRNVDKSYSGTPVLKDLSLDFFAGETTCLLGASGSGKSTLLRTINALESIQRGSITIDGESYANAQGAHLIRRKTAMIFQRFELFPHFSVEENVALAPRIVLKKTKREARDLAHECLEKVSMKDFSKRRPESLSGGQLQRVAVARALAIRPKVLLCDEPTSALDPHLKGEVMQLFAQIASEGMTMIVVTHELNFARQISNRCLFLDAGKILEDAAPQRFFDHPQSSSLSQFLRAETDYLKFTP